MKRSHLIAPLLAAATCSPLGIADAEAAQSRWVPFTATVDDSACSEPFELSGRLHVVTKLSRSGDGRQLTWAANLERASGRGRTSGGEYGATGADRGSLSIADGESSAAASPSFRLHPPSPIRGCGGVRLPVSFRFSEDGSTVTAVEVGPSVIGTTD